MLNFGPQKYYRFAVTDSFSRDLNIARFGALKNSEKYISALYNHYSLWPEYHIDIAHDLFDTEWNGQGFTTSASFDQPGFDALIKRKVGATWSIAASQVPQSATVILDQPRYIPTWFIAVDTEYPIAITVEISNDGINWQSAGSFTFDAQVDTNSYTQSIWIMPIGAAYQIKYIQSQYNKPILLKQTKEWYSPSNTQPFRFKKETYSRYKLSARPEQSQWAKLGDLVWQASSHGSLGGPMTAEVIEAQAFSLNSLLDGVSIVRGAFNPVGEAQLKVIEDDGGLFWLGWKPSGGAWGWSPLTYSGRHDIAQGFGADQGWITVDVNLDAIKVGSSQVMVKQALHRLFSENTLSEAYRCLYLHNTSTTGAARGLNLIASDGLLIGVDPAGINGVAQTIVDELTPPNNVAFQQQLAIGDLVWGRSVPIWIKRERQPHWRPFTIQMIKANAVFWR